MQLYQIAVGKVKGECGHLPQGCLPQVLGWGSSSEKSKHWVRAVLLSHVNLSTSTGWALCFSGMMGLFGDTGQASSPAKAQGVGAYHLDKLSNLTILLDFPSRAWEQMVVKPQERS